MTSPHNLADVLRAIAPTPTGEGAFRADHIAGESPIVFGGQLLAQSVSAATHAVPGKELLSLHTVFARAGNPAESLAITTEVLHAGRSFASSSVTTAQSHGVCTLATALLHAPDPDRIRHADQMPLVDGPEDSREQPHQAFWDIRIAGGVDILDPDAPTGPAELPVWVRFPGAPTDDLALNQALLAYATDGFLIATAMRPHPGVGQAMAHVSVSTTVLAHTITFHEPFDTAQWLLLDQRSTYAGRGRSHGRGNVFTVDGTLVASFSQDNMVRDMPEARRPKEGETARF